ncbi:MAG TPA: alpha/beta hydrolase [Propionibacteriaceae bacterium]
MHTTKALRSRFIATALFGLGVAGAAVVGTAFRSDMRVARARLAGKSPIVATACGPVEVATAGDGPPVLLVHRTAGGFDMGLRVGTDLLGEAFHIIAPSRFGYLRTPMPANASHARQANAFVALLDALDVPRTAVIALSAGAQPATQLALRHPERVQALVLITPALYLPPQPEGPEKGPPAFVLDHLLASDFFVWALARLAPNSLIRVAGIPRSLDSEISPEFRNKVVDWFFPAAARHVGLAYDIRTTTPIAPDLPIEQLKMPRMMISAADDPYRTADVVRYSASGLPTANVVICDSGGHLLFGQTDRLRQEIRGFCTALAHR